MPNPKTESTPGRPNVDIRDMRIGTRVRMVRTGDMEIEGCNGTIVAVPSRHMTIPLYTAHLDTPRACGDRAVSLSPSCLVRLSNHD
jgi:hypothetical protein